MNTPNNRRRRESRERIERAFVELLQSRELDEIRVTELCKRAGVNRTTFYANYADVYALADAIRDRLERELAQVLQDAPGLQVDYLQLFRHIRDNPIFYQTYFKLGYDGRYQIVGYDKELAARYFQNRFVEYHMEFFRAGLTKIIKLWLASGCRETPEELLEVIESEYRGREEFFAPKT